MHVLLASFSVLCAALIHHLPVKRVSRKSDWDWCWCVRWYSSLLMLSGGSSGSTHTATMTSAIGKGVRCQHKRVQAICVSEHIPSSVGRHRVCSREKPHQLRYHAWIVASSDNIFIKNNGPIICSCVSGLDVINIVQKSAARATISWFYFLLRNSCNHFVHTQCVK